MRNHILFSILLIFIVLASGCSMLQSSGGGGGQSYFPHADGNSWRYESTNGSSQIMTVEGTTTIGSSTIVQIFSSTYLFASGSSYTSEAYYRIDDSGVYSHGSSDYPSSIGIPFFVFPLEIGKTWDINVFGDYTNYAIILGRENVTVPAGTFDCYKINFITTYGTVETGSSNIWLGNNVGIVKSMTSGSTIESELVWKNF